MEGYEVIMTIPDYISKIEKLEKEKKRTNRLSKRENKRTRT